MKITQHSRLFVLFLSGIAAAGAGFAAETEPAAGPVTVQFFEPEKFTDLKEDRSDFGNDWGRKHFLPLLRKHLESRAGRLLADGQKLDVTFTDIDLAGDFETRGGGALDEVRIVRERYVPRTVFSFKLSGPDGGVVKEGERKLLDASFMMRGAGSLGEDSLRYEKTMLDDWLRREFGAKRN